MDSRPFQVSGSIDGPILVQATQRRVPWKLRRYWTSDQANLSELCSKIGRLDAPNIRMSSRVNHYEITGSKPPESGAEG